MKTWNQQDVRQHQAVYSSDQHHLGHIAEMYEDSFLLHKGAILPKNRYIPYSAIDTITNNRVQLLMSAQEVQEKEWEKRPDYEDHLGDPTQLFYDRGHGIHDPFDETNPNSIS